MSHQQNASKNFWADNDQNARPEQNKNGGYTLASEPSKIDTGENET